MHLFNEVMTSVYLYTLIGLTDFNQVYESKETFGMILFGIVAGTLGLNIVYFVCALLVKVCKFLKERCCGRKRAVKTPSTYEEANPQTDLT